MSSYRKSIDMAQNSKDRGLRSSKEWFLHYWSALLENKTKKWVIGTMKIDELKN